MRVFSVSSWIGFFYSCQHDDASGEDCVEIMSNVTSNMRLAPCSILVRSGRSAALHTAGRRRSLHLVARFTLILLPVFATCADSHKTSDRYVASPETSEAAPTRLEDIRQDR